MPWYELATPLTSEAEGATLSLAKHLLAAWQWNIKVHGEDNCPPAPTVLNIGQFMTNEEMTGGMGEPQWFVAYSRALQWVGVGQSLPTGVHLLVRNGHGPNGGPVLPEGKRSHHPCHHLPGRVGCLHPQPGCMGPVGVADRGGDTACPC